MKTRLLLLGSILVLLSLLAAGCAWPAMPTATPAPEPMPAPEPTPRPEPIVTPHATIGVVVFTVMFDNYAYDPHLETDWGFACLVETEDATVLFDTGGDGEILLRNMQALGKDPATVDAVVFSHEHGDHTGGIAHCSIPALHLPSTPRRLSRRCARTPGDDALSWCSCAARLLRFSPVFTAPGSWNGQAG